MMKGIGDGAARREEAVRVLGLFWWPLASAQAFVLRRNLKVRWREIRACGDLAVKVVGSMTRELSCRAEQEAGGRRSTTAYW